MHASVTGLCCSTVTNATAPLPVCLHAHIAASSTKTLGPAQISCATIAPRLITAACRRPSASQSLHHLQHLCGVAKPLLLHLSTPPSVRATVPFFRPIMHLCYIASHRQIQLTKLGALSGIGLNTLCAAGVRIPAEFEEAPLLGILISRESGSLSMIPRAPSTPSDPPLTFRSPEMPMAGVKRRVPRDDHAAAAADSEASPATTISTRREGDCGGRRSPQLSALEGRVASSMRMAQRRWIRKPRRRGPSPQEGKVTAVGDGRHSRQP